MTCDGTDMNRPGSREVRSRPGRGARENPAPRLVFDRGSAPRGTTHLLRELCSSSMESTTVTRIETNRGDTLETRGGKLMTDRLSGNLYEFH